MNLTPARLEEMQRLGLLADPVEFWKRAALENAAAHCDSTGPHSRRRSPGGRTTDAARFVGWLLVVAAVLPLTALAFTSSVSSWEAIAPVLLAGIALSWCARSTVTRYRERPWKAVTWSAIADRSPFSAHEALSHLPPRAIDVHLVAAYLDCCNRGREGVELLERARAMGVRSPETTKLLIELHHREGDAPAVRALLASDAALLSQQDREAIESALAALAG